MTDTNQNRPSEEDWKILNEHIAKANGGCKESLDWLRDFLEGNPQVWQHIGNLARTAEKAWISLAANGDQLGMEAIRRDLARLKADVLGESTSVMEEMITETILATWLELHHLRGVDANPTGRNASQTSILLKRLESAQRRHFAAIKQLAMIRKLLPEKSGLPDLRVFSTEQESA